MNNDKNEHFEDDIIFHIEDDIEKIQTKTGMYIAFLGTAGANHCVREIINNSFDECINEKSPGNNIIITYDILTDKIVVRDNGRGFVPDDMEKACTKLNAGSKFTREQGGGSSAGENGTGLTAVNALGSVFKITSYRSDGKMYQLEFREGKRHENSNWGIKSDVKIRGTEVEFSPSQFFLGKKTKIDYVEIIDWLSRITYFINGKIKIKFEVYKGFTLKEEYKFKTKPRIDFVKDHVPELISEVVSLSASTNLVEQFHGRDINRNLTIEFVFAYSNTMEPLVDSYCNLVNTFDGGIHLDVVKECICRYLQTATKKTLNDRENKTIDILWADVLSGLNYIVNLETTMNPQFASQVKNKATNEALIEPLKKIINESLNNHFENKEYLNKFTRIVKMNAKARLEMNKVKSAVIKEGLSNFDKLKMKNFDDCTGKKADGCTLYIIEGDSAKGSVSEARNPKVDAVFALRGVTLNAINFTLAEIINNKKSQEFANLLRILGCEKNGKFNPDRCKYEKIIIATDADIDGHGITSQIATFFERHLPEVIALGMLYKVFPPLYSLNTGKKELEYALDKGHYVEKVVDKLHRKVSMRKYGEVNNFDKSELFDFVYDTRSYLNDLTRVHDSNKNDIRLIEHIAIFIHSELSKHNSDNFLDIADDIIINKMNKEIQELYPEMRYENDNFVGVCNGHFQRLSISKRFLDKIEQLFYIFDKYGHYIVSNISEDKLTIGEFLLAIKDSYPKIVTRFKGLGEADSDQLKITMLNKETRHLIQLTSEDVEKEREIFNILHSGAPKYMKLRKDMVSSYRILSEDLNN